tara:strand:- start:1805 stop:2056 length:252 start_codon:yes stop_codon:yes gene_type:complete
MINIAIAGGNGPGGAAKGRIPNLFFKKKGLRARVSPVTVLIGVSGQNYSVTRGGLVGFDIYELQQTLTASFYGYWGKSQNLDI